MKRKKLNTELGVINWLLGEVNSKEDYNLLIEERSQILSSHDYIQKVKGGIEKW